MSQYSAIRMLSGVAAIALCASAGHAQEQSFSIKAQPLAAAIEELARQSNQQIIFSDALTRGKTANAVTGRFDIGEALAALLRGTGLTYRSAGAGFVVVAEPAPSRATQIAPPPQAADETVIATNDIVVTAQGRSQVLQDVPISASVTTGEAISRSNIPNLESLSARVPNFRIATASQSDFVTVRGVGSSLNLGFEQSVGTFVDGVYRGRSRTTRSGLFDIERVELLKGPQTTFFGNNTIAGAINITTRKPGDRLAANATGFYAPNTGEYTLEGGVSVPLTERFSVRLAARQSGMDGYIRNDNPLVDEDGPHLNDRIVRVAAAWQPVDIIDVDARIDFGRNRDRGVANYELTQCPPPAVFGAPAGSCARYLAANGGVIDNEFDRRSQANPSYFHYDYVEAAQTTTVSLGEHRLILTTGYFDHDYQLLYDPIPIPARQGGSVVGTDFAVATDISEKYRQFSQEVRIASPDDQAISYLAGLYFQKSKLDVDAYIGYFFAPIAANSGGALPATTPIASRILATERSEVLSGFAATTIRMTERFRVNLGLRYSRVTKKDNRIAQIGAVAGSIPAPGFTPLSAAVQTLLFRPTSVDPGNFADPKRTDSKLLPTASIQYDMTDDVMVYGSYAKGFKAGGYSIGSANASFDPETVNAFEMGLKSSLFDRRLTFNIAAFYSRYSNLQEASTILVAGAAAARQIVGNVASTITKGIEVSTRLKVTPELTLFSDLALLSSRYRDFPNGPCTSVQAVTIPLCQQNLSGKLRPFAPKYSGNAGAAWVSPLTGSLDIKIDGTLFYTSTFRQQPTSDPRLAQPSHVKIDARIAVARNDGRWEAAVVGRNLTNKLTASYRQIFPSGVGSIANLADPPRSIGFQLNFRY